MRRFLVVGHTQRARPPVPLDDPSGAGGRWDLVARAVTNALLVSHGVREDTEVVFVLGGPDGPRSLRVEGASVRRLNPDERSTVALLSRALDATDVKDYESSPLPGVHVSGRDAAAWVEDAAQRGSLAYLREDASAELASWRPPPGDVTFVLSDHKDLDPAEEAAVRAHRPVELTLGPVALHADQCIVIVHNHLDRLAGRRAT